MATIPKKVDVVTHEERYQLRCGQCGREWLSTKPDLAACRFCKSYAWNEPKRERRNTSGR